MTTINTYTLETVPVEINANQFYCFNDKTGEIMIGNIIGKSATSNKYLYVINDKQYFLPSWQCFDEKHQKIPLSGNLFCFLNYQDFIKVYYEYLDKKNQKRINNNSKKKYAVDKRTSTCLTTTVNSKHYIYFDTKKEAIDYSNKKVDALITNIKNYIAKLEKLKSKFEEYKIPTFRENIKGFIVTPHELKENDVLAQLELIDAKSETIINVKKDFIVTVKGFVSPNIAKLSDGTILPSRRK